MKLIIAVVITALVLTLAPKQNINKTVATSSKSKTSTVQAPPQAEEKAQATTKVVQEETVTPVVTSTVPNCDAHDALIAAHFGSENLITAKAIMRAESGCRIDAVGDGHITYVQNGVTYGMSCGLFQIRSLPGRPTCAEMKDPSKNIAYAGRMFAAQGWRPWSAYLNQSYRKFLR